MAVVTVGKPMLSGVEHSRLAWQRYTETGQVARELLREHVYRAWRRCEGHGTSPHILTVRELPAAEVAALQGRESALIAAARPYLQILSLATGAERHAAMLGDRHAVLLDVVGDGESLQGPGHVPLPGALLAEEYAGANGVGSPLAEGDYVELVGPEHFIAGFHDYTWQGVPLRDPGGQVTGVLAVSLRRVTDVRGTLLEELLIHAARGVEAGLLRRRLDEHASLARRAGERPNAMLEVLRQDLVQLETAARLRIERAARLLGQAHREDGLDGHSHAAMGPASGAAPGERGPGQSESTPRSSAPGDALALLRSAGDCLDRFERAAACWLALAAGASPEESDCAEVPERVDLYARLREVVWLLDTEAAMHHASLVVEPHAPGYVLAGPQALSRRLLRLLIEALQMTPPSPPGRGQEVREIRIRLRLDPAAGRVEVCVAAAVDLSLSLPLADAELFWSGAAP
jgi:hypothetical protein